VTYGHAVSLLTLCPCGQRYISAVTDNGVRLCAQCALKEEQQ
jgi:hypothetical protein